MQRHQRLALIGFLLALPMAIIFSSIVFEISWIEAAFKAVLTSDGQQLNTLGRVVVYGGIFVLPIALIVAAWPMLRRGTDGKRRFYVENAVVVAIVLATMTPTWGGLLKDFYRCDILKMENCD